jgi:hypothetical protein
MPRIILWIKKLSCDFNLLSGPALVYRNGSNAISSKCLGASREVVMSDELTKGNEVLLSAPPIPHPRRALGPLLGGLGGSGGTGGQQLIIKGCFTLSNGLFMNKRYWPGAPKFELKGRVYAIPCSA